MEKPDYYVITYRSIYQFKFEDDNELVKSYHYENINDLGLSVLSLAVKRTINVKDLGDIQEAMETIKEERSPAFFYLMRKFDFFQKGEHFRTQKGIFDTLSNCLLGHNNDFIKMEYNHIESEVRFKLFDFLFREREVHLDVFKFYIYFGRYLKVR